MKKSGIYKITNPLGEVYIGNSSDITKRFRTHKSNSKNKQNTKLQKSLFKHGIENHLFEIIEECFFPESNEREIFYIEKYDSIKNGLNIFCGGGNKKLSEETKTKISISNKGKKASDLAKKRLSEAQKGRIPWNKGLKGAQVAWNKGKEWPEETKQRLRTMNLGKKVSEETKLKTSNSLKGKAKTKEHAAKVGAKHKGKIVSEETKEKQRQSRINYINKTKNGK